MTVCKEEKQGVHSTRTNGDEPRCPHCGSRLRISLALADIRAVLNTAPLVPDSSRIVEEPIHKGGGTVRLEAVEKTTIFAAMREAGNDITLAARMLGIGKTTVYRKLKEYGYEKESPAFGLKKLVKTVILTTMRETGNDRILVAQMLRIRGATLDHKLAEYGFDTHSELVPNGQATSLETPSTILTGAEMNVPVLSKKAIEKNAILSAMQAMKNDIRLVAHELGIGRTTLYRKLKEYGFPLSHRPRASATE
jgi:DNA-binding NtrC family response regulator